MGNYITNKSNTIGIICLICVSMVTLALDLGINTSITELTCSSLRPLQNLRHTSTSGLSHHKHVALRPSFCVATNANGDNAKYSIKRLRIHIKHNHQKSHFQNETYSGKKKHGFTLRWNQAHVWCLYSVLCLKGQLHAKCMCIITITETVHFRGQLIVLMTPIPQCNVYWVSDQTVSALQCYRTRVSYKGFSITSEDSDKYN